MAFDPKIGLAVPDAQDLREQFAAVAQKEHRRGRYRAVFGVCGAILVGPAVTFWHAPRFYINAVVIPFCATGALIGLWSVLSSRRLRCPSCRTNLENLERYCPVCGLDGLEKAATFFKSIDPEMKCARCDKIWMPGVGVNRKFKIRYCSHCGVFLDNEGV
jgi:hypothetical protein